MDDAADAPVAIIGATSFVGSSLLASFKKRKTRVVAFTRSDITQPVTQDPVHWVSLQTSGGNIDATMFNQPIHTWILLAPIWAMPSYFDSMLKLGARRVVALSSTSVLTKRNSSDPGEQATIERMLEAESQLQHWAEQHSIEWAILRPTIIYGHGRDRNLSEIVRIIQKTRVFPLLGGARGLRQPVHVDDVAQACISALNSPKVNRIYVISGAEVLSYRDMVQRIFRAMGLRPVLISLPIWIFRLGVAALRLFPRYRSWAPAMVERMNLDMAFDHNDATLDLGYAPRPFHIGREDLP